MKSLLFTAFFAPGLAALAPRQDPCTRETLLEAADAYITAQTAGSLEPLAEFLAEGWAYRRVIDAADGVLATPLVVDHRRTTADVVECASYELIAADPAAPYVIGTQIRLEGGRTALIDSVVSTTNSWFFDAGKTFDHVLGEDWPEIPEEDCDDWEVIRAAGDTYLDMWSNGTAADAVPWGTPCVRLEGSAYTGSGVVTDSCEPGIPSNSNQAPNTDRRASGRTTYS